MPDPKIDHRSCSTRTVANAQALYEAYTANSDNLNFQGNPCPAWADLPDGVKSHWCASVARAIQLADLGELAPFPPPQAEPAPVPEPTQAPPAVEASPPVSVDDAIARTRAALVAQVERGRAIDVGAIAVLGGALDVLHRSPREIGPPIPASPPAPTHHLITIEHDDGKLLAAGSVHPYVQGDAARRAEVAEYLGKIAVAVADGSWG